MPIFTKQLRFNAGNEQDAMREIANHIRFMQEELEYRLANLDSSNITSINTDDTKLEGGEVDHLAELSATVGDLKQSFGTISATVSQQGQSIAALEDTADTAVATAQSIANGTYSGTFINGTTLHSPALNGVVCVPGNYGTELPASGTAGQVFFLIEA